MTLVFTELMAVDRSNALAVHRLDDSGAWSPGGDVGPGLWPLSRPGTNEWTWSVIDDASRLIHGEPGSQLEVPGSQTQPPLLLGPRLGHYAMWSPSGDCLCYVVPDGRALTLRSWRPGELSSSALLSAAPVFSAWIPASNWLLAHHGSTLSAYETVSGEQRVLSSTAAGFRTPAVRDDGSGFAWAQVNEGAVSIMYGSLEDGGVPAHLARMGTGVAMAFRPHSSELTIAVAVAPESGVFGELLAVDLSSSSGPHRIVKGPVVAFWWRPDGTAVATLHPSYTGDGRFQVRLHDPGGRFLGATEPFIPSADTATTVSFFDQYALSHPNWSADGRWFGICGRLQKDGPHASFSGAGGDKILLWDTHILGAINERGDGQMVSFGRGEVNEG